MSGRPPALRFPSRMRLKTGRDFSTLKNQGRRLVKGCLIANWLAEEDRTGSRLGVITSSAIGPAVVRSRARRLLREAFRLHQHELARPTSLVLVARKSIGDKSFQQVERDLLAALRDARLLKPQAA